MIHTFSEAELMQKIQNEAPFAAEFFKGGSLTPESGRERIEMTLWKDDISIYESLANGIARAIVEWKTHCQESVPRIITIWISYDSKLYDTTWQYPERVVVLNDGDFEAYHLHTSELKDTHNLKVERGSGPVELWFPVLTEPLMAQIPFPSIHTYLSKFYPRRNLPAAKVAVTALTFYAHTNKSEKEYLEEENRILARSSTGDHLYLEFESRKSNKIVDKLKLLFDEETIQLANNEDLLTEDVQVNWLHRYALFLRNTIMRTKEEQSGTSVPSIGEFRVTESIKERANNIFTAEKKLRLPKAPDGATRMVWADAFYNSMTNIRIFMPTTNLNLGSVAIFSDRIVGSRLTKIIASAIWPIFLQLRQVEESAISQAIFRSHALRSAVAAIMGRNMSHNIGSHVLAYLSSEHAEGDMWVT